jgi:hypothetical protein
MTGLYVGLLYTTGAEDAQPGRQLELLPCLTGSEKTPTAQLMKEAAELLLWRQGLAEGDNRVSGKVSVPLCSWADHS